MTGSSRAPRLATIGAGSIVPMHLAALRAAGFDLVSIGSRPGSDRPGRLADEFGIDEVCHSWEQVLNSRFDALLIAAATEPTALILRQALAAFDGPILVEKPVSYSSAEIEALAEGLDESRVLVGYNRRHYSSVRALHAWLAVHGPAVAFHARVPEASSDPAMSAQAKAKLLLANVVHVLDLLDYLFGPLDLAEVQRIDDASGAVARAATVRGAKGAIGTLTLTFGAPYSYSLEVLAPGSVAVLQPIEVFAEYADIEVVHPTPEVPLRRYLPVANRSFVLSAQDVDFKPGFYEQSGELCALARGQRLDHRVSATLTEAARAVRLAEGLLGA